MAKPVENHHIDKKSKQTFHAMDSSESVTKSSCFSWADRIELDVSCVLVSTSGGNATAVDGQ